MGAIFILSSIPGKVADGHALKIVTELDPAQPKMRGAGWKSNFRHYLNLHKTEGRFKRLLSDFNFTTISAGLAVGL